MNEKTTFTYENSIGAITFARNSPYWIEDIDGISGVTVSVSEAQGVGQIGATQTNQSIQPRDILISGCIFDPLEQTRTNLLHIISPGLNSTLTVQDDGKEWYLDVCPTQTPEIAGGNGVQNFQMSLHASYPIWRSVEEYSKNLLAIVGLFQFPFYTGGTWNISKFTGDYYTTIDNTGNFPLGVTLVFVARGVVVNPEVTHIGTGKVIKINKTMISGERLIITTTYGKRGAVYVDTSGVSSNGFKYIAIGSNLDMDLQPGENILKTDADDNWESLTVVLQAASGERAGL